MENKPMRVLQMIASLDFGGSQSMIINLYKAIDRSRVQFDFIVDHPDLLGLAPVVEELGAKIIFMPTFKGSNIAEVKKAWNDLFRNHPEYKIIHSHSRSYASIYLPIARKYGLKTIIHSHNTSNGSGLKAKIKDLMQYPLRYSSDYFMACSKDAGKWLFGEKIAKSDKCFVLNNAIDAKSFILDEETRNAYRKEFGVEDKKVYIQVGAFRDQKNYFFTIDLFKEFHENHPDAYLFIVGNGPQRQEIIDKLSELGMNGYVKVLLDRTDVNKLLMMADFYLMPSIFEGLSVAAIEAQSSGLPCLLSDRVSEDVKVSEVVRFLPLDKNIWLEEMSKPSQRINTYDDIAGAGFDISETANWLMNFYEGLIND